MIAHGIAWGLLLVLLAFVVPRMEAKFTDFGIPLPQLTIRVIRVSHQVLALTALILGVLVADGLMWNAQSARGESEWSRAWSLLMLVAPLLGIALTLVALALPFATIMPRLSG